MEADRFFCTKRLQMRQDDVKDLWVKAKNDDYAAFEKIYRCYNLLLRRYAKNFLKESHLIDEAVQGLFVEIYEKRKSLTISKNLPAYLCVLLRRRIASEFERSKMYVKMDEQDGNMLLLSDSETIEGNIVYSEHSAERYNMLKRSVESKLSKRQREIVKLRFYENLSNNEIAGRLGVDYGTVRNTISRALSNIRRQYRNEDRIRLFSNH